MADEANTNIFDLFKPSDRLSTPISCDCCDPPRKYFYDRGLRKHQRLNGLNPPTKRFLARAEYEADPKYCLHCTVVIPYVAIQGEPEQKFCSLVCSATFNNLQRGIRNRKYCAVCFTAIMDKQSDCCSWTCGCIFKYRRYIAAWKAGENPGGSKNVLSGYVRRYLFEKFDECCARCSWSEVNPATGKVPLQVDHKNGDSTDHREGNLDLLCPNCHALTETYGALNLGKGRQKRREWREQRRALVSADGASKT